MIGRRQFLMRVLEVGDLVVMACAFASAVAVSGLYSDGPDRLREFLSVRVSVGNLLGFVAFAAIWHVIFRSFGLYRSRRIGSLFLEWRDVFKSVVLGSLILPALALVLDLAAIDRRFMIVFFLVSLVATCVGRALMRALLGEVRRKGRNLRNVVIVGCGSRGAAVGRELRQRPDLGYLLLGFIDDMEAPESPAHNGREKLLGSLAEAERIMANSRLDEIFITLPIKTYYERIAELVAVAEDLGICVRMPADFFNLEIARADVDYLEQLPIMTMTSPAPSAGALLLKRVVDVVGASIVLIGLSPLLVAVALAIRLDSAGPVFFTQERVGLGRKRFRMLKFRTMVIDAEARMAEVAALNECRGAAFKVSNDPRITGIGRWLRRLSIDELPQLCNVLIGDMSLVGPRPPLPHEVAEYATFDRRRLSMRPGITCLWQVGGRNSVDFENWVRLDLEYIDSWSILNDVKIMLRTIPAILRGTGM